MAIVMSNNAASTLASGISSGATSFTVASGSTFPALSSGDFTFVTIGTEVIKVTARSGANFTCDQTTASHSSGDTVELRVTSELLNAFSTDEESLPKSGGAMTGAITTNSTFDGRDVAADGVTADAALPKAGGTMTGDLILGDNVKLEVGSASGGDLQLYHDASNSYISDQGTGDLRVLTSHFKVNNAANNEQLASFIADGASTLFYDGAAKIATTNTGLDVTGNVVVSGTVDGIDIATRDAILTSTTTTAGAALPKAGGTMTGDLILPDNVKLEIGSLSGGDLQIYHDATAGASYIKDVGTGSLQIAGSSQVNILNGADTEYCAKFITDGAVELYHNNVKKFETTAAGATVTGVLTATLQANAIDSDHYTDGSIDTAHFSTGAIDAAAMGGNSVASAALQTNAVETAHITNGNVTLSKMAANSVDSDQYIDGSIDRAHIADGEIIESKIQNGNVTLSKMAANSVDSDQYVNGSIDAAHIGNDQIDSQHYANGSINYAAYLGSDVVTNSKIIDAAVTAAKLSASLGDLRRGVTHIGLNSGDYIKWTDNTKQEFIVNGNVEMQLEADGDLHVDGDVIAYSTTISDERLKHDIQPITDALSKVGQLNGVTFAYNKDDKKSAGLIAQDVEKVMPSAVSEKELPLQHDDGIAYKTVQYDQTIGLLVEAIKELTAKVEELEAR